MKVDDRAQHDRLNGDATLERSQIVMGVHWDAAQEESTSEPDDLDALCVLLGNERRVIEVIHPGHPRNASDSVVHTGDSRNGASTWDDEQIFVFLEALPETVTELDFVVASATGRSLSDVRGAVCHVTDSVTESPLVQLDFASFGHHAHCVARLYRSRATWRISTRPPPAHGELLARVVDVVRNGKPRERA